VSGIAHTQNRKGALRPQTHSDSSTKRRVRWLSQNDAGVHIVRRQP
jgi:hypothetical protein